MDGSSRLRLIEKLILAHRDAVEGPSTPAWSLARGDGRDVDVLAGRKHGALTIGATNDIARRAWKIRSIERDSPYWVDLYGRLNGQALGSRQQVPGRQPWMWHGREPPV